MKQVDKHARPAFLRHGGECGRLIAQIDWAATPLGPMEAWPTSLEAMVANLVHTRQPMLLFWGPELIQFHNDSFVPSLGPDKHPGAMGRPARESWREAWPVIGKQIEAVMSRGEPTWYEDALVPIFRNGRMEEVFWTYSYSPAFGDHGEIQGTLVIVTEMTGRVLAARRLEALSRLSVALAAATDYEAAFDALADVSESGPEDLPFVVVCRRHQEEIVERAVGIDGELARRMAACALEASPAAEPLELAAPVAAPGSAWPEDISRLLVTTLRSGHGERSLVFGLSPRLPLDDGYRNYLVQITAQLGATLRRIDQAEVSRAIERQRDNLLLQAPVATALLAGRDHVYRLANPLYCELVGKNPVGESYLEAFPQLADTDLPAVLDRVYESGEPFVASEMVVPLDPSGTGTYEKRYVNFNLEALRDRDDRIYGMMAVAVDVTEQVRARQELEAIDAEREQVMGALQEANRAKDEFLAMLGHELRNPLAPIVSALELMKLKAPETSAERAAIERQVSHVIRLVDDLLDVSRITRGKISLDRERVDVRAVVEAAAELSAPLIEQRKHRVSFDLDAGIVIDADESRMVQVVSNLLTNAARYTAEGGEIRVSVTREGGEAVLRVADTGVGIDPEHLPRMFELFSQGQRSVDRSEGGLGIGLALVKSLVELHGGRVSAHSEGLGRGSEFTVRLPLADAVAERSVPAPEPEALGGAPRRVLIVDDNRDAAELLGEVIASRGHQPAIAHDPATALAMVEDFAPEVAILDIGLPQMDGYELAGELHALVPACRLIALTGYGQEGDRERSRAAGFDAHLVKPVRVDALSRVVDQLSG